MKKLVLILLMASSSVFAQSKQDGNQFLTDVKKSDLSFMFYLGYVRGVSDNMPCIPISVTNGQALDIVQKYIEQNPAIRHEYQEILVYKALNTAFPCKKPS